MTRQLKIVDEDEIDISSEETSDIAPGSDEQDERVPRIYDYSEQFSLLIYLEILGALEITEDSETLFGNYFAMLFGGDTADLS